MEPKTDAHKPILCLDFDGVIHSYESGWKGADVISDLPVPHALPFISSALEHFEVHIFSSRSNQAGGIEAMRTWFDKHCAAHWEPWGESPLDSSMVQWPTEKPPAMVTLDDRALTFTGTWPSIESLLAFRPWNKNTDASN